MASRLPGAACIARRWSWRSNSPVSRAEPFARVFRAASRKCGASCDLLLAGGPPWKARPLSICRRSAMSAATIGGFPCAIPVRVAANVGRSSPSKPAPNVGRKTSKAFSSAHSAATCFRRVRACRLRRRENVRALRTVKSEGDKGRIGLAHSSAFTKCPEAFFGWVGRVRRGAWEFHLIRLRFSCPLTPFS